MWLSEDAAFFVGTVADTGFHEHHAIQVTLSLKNDFIIQIGGRSLSATGIVIHPNQPHRLIGKEGVQFIMYFDPASPCGALLATALSGSGYSTTIINAAAFQDYIIPPDDVTTAYIEHVIEQTRTWLLPGNPSGKRIDTRIQKAINHIKAIEEKKISVAELSSRISLSTSRLQHLFKSQTGISIKKYLLWCRLIDGIHLINKKNNFTFAAHLAGFSDSAHMSRTFKKMFGVKLTDFFKK